MVPTIPNPALEAFVAHISSELIFAQVLIRKTPGAFQLSHIADRNATSLRVVTMEMLRDIAQFTAKKQFRPLKSAPNLQGGWMFVAHHALELNDALQCLYPSAVADWFAAQQPNPPVTHYREFTSRQTGMYRVTTMLNNAQAAVMARACCPRQFCLKQRLWEVEDLRPDSAVEKSLIPCLEPCAVLLEFARTTARLEQREKYAVSLAVEEIETGEAALERTVQGAGVEMREADFSAADNPRRAQWLLEKLRSVLKKGEYEED